MFSIFIFYNFDNMGFFVCSSLEKVFDQIHNHYNTMIQEDGNYELTIIFKNNIVDNFSDNGKFEINFSFHENKMYVYF